MDVGREKGREGQKEKENVAWMAGRGSERDRGKGRGGPAKGVEAGQEATKH